MSAPRVLVVRFSAIGDCVMTAWAASAIRERHPDAFICWAVESRCAPVIDRTTLTSRVEEFPRDRWKRARWSPETWRQQIAKFAGMRRLRFDVGFDFQGHSKTALCLRLAHPTRRIAARATDPIAARLNPIPRPRPLRLHTIEWHALLIKTVDDYEMPERPFMPRDPEVARALVERIGGDRPLATITVSAGQAEKAYSAEGWRTVAEGLIARGYRVAFLGGPTDAPIELEGTVDLVGKLPLASTIEAVRLSAIHFSADTGNGHIAAAVGVPTVSVFGPTDPNAFRPFTKQGRTLWRNRTTTDITPEEILAAAHDLVGR